MEEVLDLVAPELALVFDLGFAGEVADDEDGLVGDFRFFYAEFEILFFGGVGPMEADILFGFAFHYFGAVGGTVPRKTKNIIPFIHFICKPLLQASGSA